MSPGVKSGEESRSKRTPLKLLKFITQIAKVNRVNTFLQNDFSMVCVQRSAQKNDLIQITCVWEGFFVKFTIKTYN
jgi:hypothetical protein